jgi:hypothetical protein
MVSYSIFIFDQSYVQLMRTFQRQQRDGEEILDIVLSLLILCSIHSVQEFGSRVHGALSTIVLGGESEHPGSGVK